MLVSVEARGMMGTGIEDLAGGYGRKRRFSFANLDDAGSQISGC